MVLLRILNYLWQLLLLDQYAWESVWYGAQNKEIRKRKAVYSKALDFVLRRIREKILRRLQKELEFSSVYLKKSKLLKTKEKN